MGVYDELLKRNSAIDAVTGGFQAPQGSIPTLALRQMALSKVNDDRNFRLNESAVTERYMPQEAEDMVRKLADLKNRYASSDVAGQKDIVNQSKGLRNDWTMRGLDPNAIQSGISSDEMFKRVGQMGKTPQGLQRAFDNKMDTDKFKRGIFENDRGFNRGVLENDRSFGRGVFESDRGFNRNAFESDRGFNRSAFESDRGYDRNAFESDRNFDLAQDDNDLAWAKTDYDMQNSGGAEYDGLSPTAILSNVKGKYSEPIYQTDQFGQQQKVGTQITPDKKKREDMFLEVVDMKLPSSTQTRQVLRSLGMTNEEIDGLVKKHGGK